MWYNLVHDTWKYFYYHFLITRLQFRSLKLKIPKLRFTYTRKRQILISKIRTHTNTTNISAILFIHSVFHYSNFYDINQTYLLTKGSYSVKFITLPVHHPLLVFKGFFPSKQRLYLNPIVLHIRTVHRGSSLSPTLFSSLIFLCVHPFTM